MVAEEKELYYEVEKVRRFLVRGWRRRGILRLRDPARYKAARKKRPGYFAQDDSCSVTCLLVA